MIEHILLKQLDRHGQYVVEKWDDGRLLGSVAFATRCEAIAVTTESCSGGSKRNFKYE